MARPVRRHGALLLEGGVAARRRRRKWTGSNGAAAQRRISAETRAARALRTEHCRRGDATRTHAVADSAGDLVCGEGGGGGGAQRLRHVWQLQRLRVRGRSKKRPCERG